MSDTAEVSADTVILVPRRAGVAERDRLWDFTRDWWQREYPDWPIVEGHHDFGPFNRSAAINQAAAAAGEWKVAIIIDGDVLANPAAVRTAVDIARQQKRMVLGFHERVHLSKQGTAKVMDGYGGDWKAAGMVAKTYLDSCSSLVVVNRALWDEVDGFDEAFSGWGWEDVGFRIACETLGDGPMIQLASSLFHLWHTTSHENNRNEPTFVANRERGERYKAAHFDPDAVRALIAEFAPLEMEGPLPDTRIPRILHRTVPAEPGETAEHWWTHFQQLHPGWEFMDHHDPLDPDDYPITGELWESCTSGAQKAGLIRLEVLYTHGGVYVDSDVEPYRSLEPLLDNSGFAAWEDAKVVPDAVLGFEPKHPAVAEMLDRAQAAVEDGEGAWYSGPGVTTAVLPGRRDVLLLPPGAFYPYHYTDKVKGAKRNHRSEQPWCFMAHHWAHSWEGR